MRKSDGGEDGGGDGGRGEGGGGDGGGELETRAVGTAEAKVAGGGEGGIGIGCGGEAMETKSRGRNLANPNPFCVCPPSAMSESGAESEAGAELVSRPRRSANQELLPSKSEAVKAAGAAP